MKKNLWVIITAAAISLLSFTFLWMYEGKYFVGRANIVQTSFSINNSYVFASPLQAEANGQERIRVTVFVLNDQGLGVPGRTVNIFTSNSLKQIPIQPITDQYGKAVYDISSLQAGEYYLEIRVDTVALPQKIRVSFI